MKTTLSYTQMVKLYHQIENMVDKISYRIKMEKEYQGLSYIDLERKLKDLNFDRYETYFEEDIRKKLEAKNPEPQLIEDLCKVLNIEDKNENISEAVATYKYYLNEDRATKGRISKQAIREKKENYEKIHKELELSSGDSLEKTIYETFRDEETYSFNGIECDWDLYCEFKEDDEKKELIKKILVIYEYFPNEIYEFVDNFEFDDECNDKLKKIDVEIKYL